MECRSSLVLALGFVAGIAGCTPQGTLPLVARDSHAEQTAASEDGPKRTPRAPTCVAAGQYREQEANNPTLAPAVREQLREQARKAYQQAIRIDANYLPAHRSLAHLYETTGNHERAVATFENVLKDHSNDASLWFDLGMLHSRHQAWDPAVEALGHAADADRENRLYAKTLGFCLARAGRIDESFACFEKSVGPAKAHYNVAEMLHHLQQDDQAKLHLQMALEADPQLTVAADLLATIEGKTKEPNQSAITAGAPGPEGVLSTARKE
jgi:tetratricopeptide (TPR) repeat protein